MPTVFVEIDGPDGRKLFNDAGGAYLGCVILHPRIEGAFMAMYCTNDRCDCGFKKYKTARGAAARVRREIAKYLSEGGNTMGRNQLP